MGKGDKKTAKGKIFKGSYGIKRPRKKRKKNRVPKRFELCILESLKKDEKQTGEILHNETIKYKKFIEPNLTSSLTKIESKKEFISVFNRLVNHIKKGKVFIILHIESHGSEEGIHLSNGEIFSWEEFFNETRKLNLLLKNSLIINLAMCHGVSLIAKINPVERAPFRAIIGITDKISWGKLLEGFEEFYNNFFFTFDGEESVIKVNEILNSNEGRFFYLKSEEFIDGFIDMDRDPEFTKRLINNYAILEKVNNPALKNSDFQEAIKSSERFIESVLTEVKSKRDFFLMKDVKSVF